MSDYGFMSFIDVETTGFDSLRHCVITLASYVTDLEYNIVDEFYGEFRPDGSRKIVWTDKAEEIHKITWDRAIKFPPAIEGAEKFNRFQRQFSKTLFVAHNAPFDYRMINGLLHKADVCTDIGQMFTKKEDTVQLLRRSGLVSTKSTKLGVICKELGIEHDHHDAKSDARVLIKIHQLCKQKLGNTDLATYVPEEAQGESI